MSDSCRILAKELSQSELVRQLMPYEGTYGIVAVEGKMAGQRLAHLIQTAHAKIGKKTVVIIDEYDAPMLDVLHDDEKMAEVRRMMQEFYVPLKACDADLRFVFITGITKFSQLLLRKSVVTGSVRVHLLI